jgi:hypothetical protein
MATKPKVIIGMPATDIVRARTAHAIGCAVIASKGVIVDFLLKQSCELASARTWLVQEAIKLGGTHLLFWDSDICPVNTEEGQDFNVVERMLKHEKPIVGVQYNKRKFPLEPVYVSHHEEWQEKVSDTELFNAQFAGTGFMLIDLSIFKDIKGAWFAFGRDSQGALALGEDAWFCNTARDSGFETWIDPTIKVLHIGEYLY